MNRVLPCPPLPKQISVREHDYSLRLIKNGFPNTNAKSARIAVTKPEINETTKYKVTELFIEPITTNVVKVAHATFRTNIRLNEVCHSEIALELTPIDDLTFQEEMCTVTYLLETCKVCLKDLSNVHEKILFFDDFGHITNEIKEILIAIEAMKVEVTNDDNIPKQICIECYKTFSKIATFMQNCNKSSSALSNICDFISKQPPNVKVEENDLDIMYDVSQEICEIKEECEDWFEVNVDYSHETNGMDENVQMSTQTEHSNPIVKSYICIRCGENFDGYRSLVQHKGYDFCVREDQPECRICKKKLPTVTDLDHHIENSHSCFSCSKCSKSFNLLSKLHKHERCHETLICDFCTQSCYSKKSMRLHLMSHVIGIYPCQFCEQRFATRKMVGTHKKQIHPNELYKCPHCPKEFRIKDTYRVHIMKHNPDKRHKCTYCTSQFVHRHHLENHIRTHTKESPFLCNYCGRAFRGEATLRDHLTIHDPITYPRRKGGPQKSIKSKITTKRCDLCDYTSIHGNLKKHMMNVHGSAREIREFKRFEYVCHICDKAFRASTSLENHLHTHNEVRDFHCTYCKASFRKAYYLRLHIDGVHLNKRPNKCDQCDAAYLMSNDLKRHKMKKHSTERPYHCYYCQKAFAVAPSLKLHINRVHVITKDKFVKK